MRIHQVVRGQGPDGLRMAHAPDPRPGADQVLVRIHAASLNHRDLLVARGQMGAGDLRIPLSDAVGEVVEVGADVSRFVPGDRVMPIFFPQWLDGHPTEAAIASSLGGNVDGVLAEFVVASEQSLVRAPATLSWIEASTLACAGVTAWHALFERHVPAPGTRVLVQGTGGVSTWALQLAVAAGLRVTVVSRRGAGLERARALGAEHAIQHAVDEDWDARVRPLTDGGVDLALDIGGAGTIARSLRSTRPGGSVVTIGGVSGGFGLNIDPFALTGGRTIAGVIVGSRSMAESLAGFIDANAIRPVIDTVKPFHEAREAYRHLESGSPFGKVVIDVSGED